MDPKIAAMLAAAGRTAESFPPDFASALLTNRVSGADTEVHVCVKDVLLTQKPISVQSKNNTTTPTA